MSRRPLIFLRLFTHEASARVPTHSRGLTHLPALSLAQNQGWLSRKQPCSLQAMEAQAFVISQRFSSPKSISLEPSSRKGAFSTPCGMWKFHRPSQLLLSRGHRPLYMPRLYQASHQPCPCRDWDRNIKYYLEGPPLLQIKVSITGNEGVLRHLYSVGVRPMCLVSAWRHWPTWIESIPVAWCSF